MLIYCKISDKYENYLIMNCFVQNLSNRQKPGCEKGTGIDRARMNMTK